MSKVTLEQILEIMEGARLEKDVSSLDYTKPLREQGIDSLDYSGVLFNLEEVLGIEIPDTDVDGLQTINDILVYVNNKVS